jgi:hypothetical protein
MRIMGNQFQGTTYVAHNHVSNTTYSGIAVGWHAGATAPPPGSPWQYVVEKNLVEDIGQGVLNDFGGLYISMGSPGYLCEDTASCYIPALFQSNLVRRVHAYNWAGNGAYTVRTLIILLTDRSYVILYFFTLILLFLFFSPILKDENVAGVTFYGNSFTATSHVGVYLHCGDNLTVTNNILYAGDYQQKGQTGLFGSCNTGGVKPHETNISALVNLNVMVVTGPSSTLFDAGELFPINNMTFAMNTYWAMPPLNASSLWFPPNITFSQWQARGEDIGSVIANPLIANPTTDNNANWTLLPGSPSLAIGFTQLTLSDVGPQ